MNTRIDEVVETAVANSCSVHGKEEAGDVTGLFPNIVRVR